jgi:hypothetical protein
MTLFETHSTIVIANGTYFIPGLSAQKPRDIAGRHSDEVARRWRNSPEWREALLVAAESADANE